MLIFLLVGALTLFFLVGYAFKGWQVNSQLRTALKGVNSFRNKGMAPPPDDVGKHFQAEPLKHLWSEFADTLHELKKASAAGGVVLTEIRATMPAEILFTREVLVPNEGLVAPWVGLDLEAEALHGRLSHWTA